MKVIRWIQNVAAAAAFIVALNLCFNKGCLYSWCVVGSFGGYVAGTGFGRRKGAE